MIKVAHVWGTCQKINLSISTMFLLECFKLLFSNISNFQKRHTFVSSFIESFFNLYIFFIVRTNFIKEIGFQTWLIIRSFSLPQMNMHEFYKVSFSGFLCQVTFFIPGKSFLLVCFKSATVKIDWIFSVIEFVID